MWILYIVLAVIAIVIFGGILVYNSLIRLRNNVDEAWSDIDVQLKRRTDLIPNLIETVKGYAKHEKAVFAEVTEARSAIMKAKSPKDLGKAENMMAGALKSLFAVAENYPELKANENFLKLQDELSDTENKILASRRFYNENVKAFNVKQQVFPYNFLAKAFGFTQREFFEVESAAERNPVKVKF
jgi:LemA protein